MYLILYDADSNETLEVFHDGVDVTGLRAAGEDPTEKVRRRRSIGEGPPEKRTHSRTNHGSDTM